MALDPFVLVARVQALGVVIRAEGGDLVLAPAGVVPPDLKAELRAAKPALLTALRLPPPPPLTAALRAVYRAQFEVAVQAADDEPIDPATVIDLRRRRARLTDDVGPWQAAALFTDELSRFRAETGRCGFCGGLDDPLEGL